MEGWWCGGVAVAAYTPYHHHPSPVLSSGDLPSQNTHSAQLRRTLPISVGGGA
jgi:hypothetical protein